MATYGVVIVTRHMISELKQFAAHYIRCVSALMHTVSEIFLLSILHMEQRNLDVIILNLNGTIMDPVLVTPLCYVVALIRPLFCCVVRAMWPLLSCVLPV